MVIKQNMGSLKVYHIGQVVAKPNMISSKTPLTNFIPLSVLIFEIILSIIYSLF